MNLLLLLLACAEPCEESFQLEDELSAGQVDDALSYWVLSDPAELTCEQVCASVYELSREGYAVRSVTSCDMGLDVEAAQAAGDDPDALVGNILCAGWALQEGC